MPRKPRTGFVDVIKIAGVAREAAKGALQTLRKEIASVQRRLEKLVAEDRSFRLDLFGTGGPGRPPRAERTAKRVRAIAQKPRHKGPPKADSFFKKLPKEFTLDDVRKVAGKLSGVSLAQWSRSKKIKKTGKGYQKVA